MKVRSKKPVWFLFKLVELLLSMGCCIVHVRCFQQNGLPHIFLLCAAYGGSIIIGILSLIGLFYAEKPKMNHEALHAGILGFFHLLTVFGHMHMAMKDHFQGKDWPGLFNCSRDNSIVALYTAAIYFLHMTFALDLMFSHRHTDQKNVDRSKRPLSLYFISPGVEEYMLRFWWFRLLANRMLTSAETSDHSNRNRRMSYDTESDEEPPVSAPPKDGETRISGSSGRSTVFEEGETRRSGSFRRSDELKERPM